jgi:RNA-directed DNA polymerase
MLFDAIYEQDFLDVSYGDRAGKSAKGTVGDLTFQVSYGTFGYVGEADIQGFFDNIDHEWLRKRLALRIDDKAFLHLIRNRFHPGMERRFSFLGVDVFWGLDRQGTPRVTRRTARKKLCSALKRIKEWIRLNRPKKTPWFFKKLNEKLQGPYQDYGVRGNSRSLWMFYEDVKEAGFKRLNRRSQWRSYTWEAFKRLLSYINRARPRITEPTRLHRVAC